MAVQNPGNVFFWDSDCLGIKEGIFFFFFTYKFCRILLDSRIVLWESELKIYFM